jgi:Na+/H+ antiporter NhaC
VTGSSLLSEARRLGLCLVWAAGLLLVVAVLWKLPALQTLVGVDAVTANILAACAISVGQALPTPWAGNLFLRLIGCALGSFAIVIIAMLIGFAFEPAAMDKAGPALMAYMMPWLLTGLTLTIGALGWIVRKALFRAPG